MTGISPAWLRTLAAGWHAFALQDGPPLDGKVQFRAFTRHPRPPFNLTQSANWVVIPIPLTRTKTLGADHAGCNRLEGEHPRNPFFDVSDSCNAIFDACTTNCRVGPFEFRR
jgi:hypothetical protein